jgi:heterodisulfide reductase subunit C
VGVECGICVERCPFDVEIIAKMHADARHRTAAVFEDRAA